MSKITLPPLSPQTRSQQRQMLQRSDPAAYRWIIGVRVKATQGAGFAQSLLWVPAMLPTGYIPVWAVCGEYAPALLQLEIDAHLGEGREMSPFLIPLSATEKLRAYCEVYNLPQPPTVLALRTLHGDIRHQWTRRAALLRRVRNEQ